ncbi:hypothetical protein [Streptomyces sp. NPDC059009]|uniref:hypothetical protein n=1 Tax=Streptomyces sp. NPDC059009 TaxID=3346694 RepID=UPI0036AD2FFD
MTTLLIALGLLAGVALLLIVVLLRRRNGATHNVDGLLIEQHHREQARSDRSSYSSFGAHNSPYSVGRRHQK